MFRNGFDSRIPHQFAILIDVEVAKRALRINPIKKVNIWVPSLSNDFVLCNCTIDIVAVCQPSKLNRSVRSRHGAPMRD